MLSINLTRKIPFFRCARTDARPVYRHARRASSGRALCMVRLGSCTALGRAAVIDVCARMVHTICCHLLVLKEGHSTSARRLLNPTIASARVSRVENPVEWSCCEYNLSKPQWARERILAVQWLNQRSDTRGCLLCCGDFSDERLGSYGNVMESNAMGRRSMKGERWNGHQTILS